MTESGREQSGVGSGDDGLDEVLSGVLIEACAAMRAGADAQVARLVAALTTTVSDYRRLAPEPLEEVRAAARLVFDATLETIETGRFPVRLDLERIGQERAQQRVSLDALIAAQEVGHRLGWEALAGELGQRIPGGADGTRLFRLAGGRHLMAVCHLARIMELGHRSVREKLEGSLERRRADLAHDLLEGRFAHEQELLREAAERGVDLHGPHMLVVLVAPGHVADRNELRACVRALERAFAGSLVARYMDGQPPSVGMVMPTGAASPTQVRRELLRLVSEYREITALLTITAGRHRPAEYQEAFALAREVVQFAGPMLSGGLIDPAGVELLLAVTPDRARVVAFVERICGPLLTEPAARLQTIADTVLTYYSHGRSISETAKALRMGRNSVRRWLVRTEESTGRSVEGHHVALGLAFFLLPTVRPDISR